GIPVVRNARSSAGGAFMRIAARVDGEDVPLMDLETKNGLLSRLKGMVGMNGRAYSHA
ncbi:MAG: septum site-determining protein MinD, partial [Chloroflexi bacterium]|nr:septum site-determining protein MinD [Chloroflexota bacterium]